MYEEQNQEQTTHAVEDLDTMIKQREELDAQIAQAKKTERKAAIQKIASLMENFEITVKDLPKAKPKTTRKVAPKYQDPNSSATWSGRGKTPKWYDPATAIIL